MIFLVVVLADGFVVVLDWLYSGWVLLVFNLLLMCCCFIVAVNIVYCCWCGVVVGCGWCLLVVSCCGLFISVYLLIVLLLIVLFERSV